LLLGCDESEKQEFDLTDRDYAKRLGYGEESARKIVSQFLKSRDPQISMLRRFAKAVGVKVSTLVKE
jgi:transcriptional regulator with XRE-family HTH domain